MTQEDKQLLLKDLSGRLPYGVNCKMVDDEGEEIVDTLTGIKIEVFDKGIITDIKPYLRPMSSMTDEEKEEFISFVNTNGCYIKTMDFCYAHHLDNRGLIEKGLALEAPEDMYKND